MALDRLTIKDWPEHEKPRERLFRLGPQAISDAELLAILLGTGNARETAFDLAKRLVHWGESHYGPGLEFLKESSAEEIMSLSGIGPAKAARLKACLEISRRLQKAEDHVARFTRVRHGKDVYRLLKGDMEDLDREHFCIIMLNVRNQIIAREVISVGSLDTSIAHPREIFKNCIKKSAATVILAHNHPSGDAAPSDDDIKMTKRIMEAGKIVGIHVLDHVIVGRGQYFSMRESLTDWFTW
ncbi:MAG: RadC family protein [Bacillota bacterium]